MLSSYNNTSLQKFLPRKFPAIPTYKLIIPTFNCMCIPTINLLTADDVKVILNEGMPHHRNPFDKGRLIINFKVGIDDCLHLHLWIALFQVKFPSPGFLNGKKLKELAKLLPSPEEEPMHTNDYYEEVWIIPHFYTADAYSGPRLRSDG